MIVWKNHDRVIFCERNKIKKGWYYSMKKQAFNPYLPSWEYIPDGEPYVFNGRVYVYGSHDFYNGYVFCMGDYVCWSAPVDDLGNWRYEGTLQLSLRPQAFRYCIQALPLCRLLILHTSKKKGYSL